VNDERPNFDPFARATEWVAKITTVGVVMVLPVVGGHYLDLWLGTRYWVLLGVVFGMVAGMWHLLRITQSKSGGKDKSGGAYRD